MDEKTINYKKINEDLFEKISKYMIRNEMFYK